MERDDQEVRPVRVDESAVTSSLTLDRPSKPREGPEEPTAVDFPRQPRHSNIHRNDLGAERRSSLAAARRGGFFSVQGNPVPDEPENLLLALRVADDPREARDGRRDVPGLRIVLKDDSIAHRTKIRGLDL